MTLLPGRGRTGVSEARASSAGSVGPRSGGLYGTVLVLAVITTLTHGYDHTEVAVVLSAVVVTTIVFWVVHVYADTLVERVSAPDRRWREIAVEHARHDVTIIEAAIPPAIPLALGTAGLLSRETAVWAAIVLGLVDLFGWGALLGRALGYGRSRTVVIGLLNVPIGAVMVGLKVLVH
ncbi:MAG: hypothetical protein JWQ20_3302 [Conexibacter sp.]|nr:hypothetical protein [Conexibacter sp.]